jgi:hypothetical protein
MKKFELEAKKGQNREKAQEVFEAIWDKQVSGSQYELIVRHLLTVKGLQSATVRAKGRVDQTIRFQGKTYRIEIKTGTGICATVGAKLGDHITNYGVQDIYPNADIVIFAPGADDFSDLDQVLYESLVFMSPAAFAEYVIANSGKRKHGFETAFKLAVNDKALREKNEAIPARPMVDKAGNPVLDDEGNPKFTKRGVPRYTDCIVMQEAYNNQLVEAVLENVTDELTLGQFLQDIDRYQE